MPKIETIVTPGLAVALFLAVICVALLALVLQLLIRRRGFAQLYALKPSLFTPAERSFLGCLDSILPVEIRIFAKVRLADIFEVKKTSDRSRWQSAFNKIKSKHVDFILCRASDLQPLLAIELNDKSHAREDRQLRDDFLESLFAASNLKLLRFKVQRAYRPEEIAKRVNEALAPAQDALH